MRLLNIHYYLFRDCPESYQYFFQDGASPPMEEVEHLHNKIMRTLSSIVGLVFWMIWKSLVRKAYYKLLTVGALVEIIWTTIPAVVLVFIALPSLRLLYKMDEGIDSALTIKVVGHQWYWSYEYSDYFLETLEFDSYMTPTAELKIGRLRLLEVDNILVIPFNTNVRALITSGDVLHSFTVPALSVKTDAIPGRLNQIHFRIKRAGVFHGQCSEICGANHSFMPILVQAVSIYNYLTWISSQ